MLVVAVILAVGSGCVDDAARAPLELAVRTGHAGPWRRIAQAELRAQRGTHFELRVRPVVRGGGLSVLAVPSTGLRLVRIGGTDHAVDRQWPIYSLDTPVGPSAHADLLFDHWYPVRPNFVAVGSAARLTRALLRFELPSFAAGTALMLIGLVALLASFDRIARRSSVTLGVFALAIGAVVTLECNTLSPLMGVGLDANPVVHVVASFAAVGSIAWFLATVFGDGRHRVLHRVGAISLVAAPSAVALHLLHVVPARVTRQLVYALFVVVLVAGSMRFAPLVRARDRRARVVSVGFALLILLNVPGVLAGLGVRFDVNRPLGAWGAVAFVLALVKVLEIEFRSNSERLVATSGSLEDAVVELRASSTSVESLNSELRSQVRDRSRDLGTVLQKLPELPSAPADFPPGTVIAGRYRIVRRLGAGGMGTVHEVERVDNKRRLALKCMLGAISGINAARFTREAEIASQIRHPRLVPVVDVGLGEWGSPYLVMELVEGPPVSAFRESRFGNADWALPILADVADGLAALHAAGIVHRDLKPENVLLGSADERAPPDARIADFGISRVGEVAVGAMLAWDGVELLGLPSGTKSLATLDERVAHTVTLRAPSPSALTDQGALIGTAAYMAPEAIRGVVAPSLDVFAFGVMAFEMLSGSYPFAACPVLSALAGKDEPLIADVLCAPKSVRKTLIACVATDPRARPSARELGATLAATARRR